MTHDIAGLATRAVKAGEDGLEARRALHDLANWDKAIVDLTTAGPALAAALAGDDDDAAHRAVDTIARIANHIDRGKAVGFLDRDMPDFVTKPFYGSMLPALAATAGRGTDAQRIEAIRTLPSILASLRPDIDRSGLDNMRAALEAATRSDKPAIVEAARTGMAELDALEPK